MTTSTSNPFINDAGPGASGFWAFWPSGINNLGEVVGTSETDARGEGTISVSAGITTAWFERNGVVTPLTAPAGAPSADTAAYGVNDAGDVVGAVGNDVSLFGSTGIGDVAVIWHNGQATMIAPPGATVSQASMINNQGQVLVGSDVGAFIWQNGTMTEIAPNVSAKWINDLGQVVGEDSREHAFEWQNGVLTELSGGIATEINNNGIIIGSYVWVNGIAGTLPGLYGPTLSIASINDSNLIVGMTGVTGDSTPGYPTVWKNGIPYDLRDFIPANSGWSLVNVTAINDQNQVIGEGTYNGRDHTYVINLPTIFPDLPIAAQSAIGGSQSGLMTQAVTVTDSLQNVLNNLPGLQSMQSAGLLTAIDLTDASVPGNITLSSSGYFPQQPYAQLLDAVAIPFTVTLDLRSYYSKSITEGSLIHPTIAEFSPLSTGDSYSFVAAGDGIGLTVSLSYQYGGGSSESVSHITAIQYGSTTDIVASQTPALAGGVSSAQVTELYAAALGREPDLTGLAYYENVAATNPGANLWVLAQWFLQSPEYTGNAAHAYTQTTDGDAQFIGDLYTNLLHRSGSLSDIHWYQSNVIAPVLANLTPGSAAYSAAELQAHAAVLADISQSPEFLKDVQTTGSATSDAQHWLILI